MTREEMLGFIAVILNMGIIQTVFFLEFKFWGGKCLFGEGSWEAQATGRYAASCLGGSGGMPPPKLFEI